MNTIYTIISLLIAIICHEVAHGYAAYVLGDDTAKSDGRLSFNPLNHIDPVGLMAMVIFRFGWAKAVPINPYKFKNRKRDTIIVSLAGVTANFLLAILFGVIYVGLFINNKGISEFFMVSMWYNVMLGVFNLVPIPPLDGSKVLASLLPERIEYLFYKYERYLYILLVIGVFTGSVSKVISPIIFKIINLIIGFASGIFL